MRKVILSALLGLGALGFTDTNEAKASWLSEALNNSQIQVNIGSQYPRYPVPVYAPAPAYPVYRPTYSPPAYSYYPASVYTPGSVIPVPAYRPAPVNVPTHSYYGPNRYEHDRHDRHDWHDGRNSHDWRR
jgi:hypothetical protein